MISLRAFLITKVGDMKAFQANQYIRGPNAFSPCRSCQIQGCHDPDSRGTIYYYPLKAPIGAVCIDGSPAVDWFPDTLPLRTDYQYSYGVSMEFIAAGLTEKERKYHAQLHGINGESILVSLPGFDRARSGPHEFMHLLEETIKPMLVDFWTGHFKSLDTGTESYEISTELWELIGIETAAANATIPTAFCSKLPNIAQEQHLFTAEAWCFWFQYLASYLLKGRLAGKYYNHMLLLVEICQLCMQMQITDTEIETLEQKIRLWVEQYEKYGLQSVFFIAY